MLILPELKLYQFLQYILDTIRTDYSNNTNEKETILYTLYKDAIFKNLDINYFEEAKKIFLRDLDDPRRIDLRMFFDPSMASVPCIHINLPSDSPNYDGIGIDQGYEQAMLFGKGDEASQINTRKFNAVYQIIIASENVTEVIVMYHTVRAFLISMLNLLDINGLQNPKLGGGDIQFNADIVPPRVFMRAITLNCFYEVSVPSIIREKIISQIQFIPTPINP